GRYRALVLYDTLAAPLASDSEQKRWALRALGNPGAARMTFVVSNRAQPSLLENPSASNLPSIMREGRTGVWFTGGVDNEPAAIKPSGPPLMVHSPPATSVARQDSGGIPKYRLIELEGNQARVLGERQSGGAPAAFELGRLHVSQWAASADGRSVQIHI